MKKKVKIGSVSVDSGLIWCGDPCYFWKPKKGEPPSAVTREIGTWGEMGEQFFATPFPHHKDFNQLGVVVSSGMGDGTYPVYATIDGGTICDMTVVFVEGDDEEEEEDLYTSNEAQVSIEAAIDQINDGLITE